MINILVGKSACGKNAIQEELVHNFDFLPIISTTSRPMREGEKDGVEYYFTDKEGFKFLIKMDRLIEYRTYNTTVNGVSDTWYYGLAKQEFYDTNNYVVILDLKGTKDFISCVGADKCKVFYIDCPSDIRTQRAKLRGSFDSCEWERRLKADDEDFSADKFDGLDYDIVLNYDKPLLQSVIEVVSR